MKSEMKKVQETTQRLAFLQLLFCYVLWKFLPQTPHNWGRSVKFIFLCKTDLSPRILLEVHDVTLFPSPKNTSMSLWQDRFN